MKIRILNIDHHRNGVGAAPFHAVIFRDGPGGGVKLGVVFDAPGHAAVLDVALLADCDVEFGSNSWCGDRYEPALRQSIAEHDRHSEKQHTRRSLT